ncbi:hypothetical protein ACH5RR_010731 [Cinchona calisaya]|uniref:U1 small nuclear ribonucleoprotein C n=1 Tax=Cinchona calisaya TaxID=153742 RepID=A0ABD3AJX1_9GENT
MPRYYCDYCDTYLTHDSPSVRKQHNAGYKHKANVRTYYQQYEAQLNQSLIDQRVKEHLGAYRPVVAPYNPLRPGLPVLPTPQMPMPMPMPMPLPGTTPLPATAPLIPGFRPPPMLPRPAPGPPGYTMPQMMPLPTAPLPGQLNGIPRPLSTPAPMVPGSAGMPASSGAPPMFAPMYQGNMAVPTAGSGESSDLNAQATEANH